jgi:hypothetical protein
VKRGCVCEREREIHRVSLGIEPSFFLQRRHKWC